MYKKCNENCQKATACITVQRFNRLQNADTKCRLKYQEIASML
jgi:hypothetical protein